MLYHSFYFWLGELGLVMTLSGCAVLSHRFRDEHLLVILPFYLTMLVTLSVLISPAVYTFDHAIPKLPYVMRFSIGCLVMSRLYVWRKLSDDRQVVMMDKILRWVVVGGTLVLVFLGYRLRSK